MSIYPFTTYLIEAYYEKAIGIFEVEFQDKNANTLTVTENKTPGTAPAGFAFLDPSTYKIVLDKGADNLTLQKVDFIFDPTRMFSFPIISETQNIFIELCFSRHTEGRGHLEVESWKAMHRDQHLRHQRSSRRGRV